MQITCGFCGTEDSNDFSEFTGVYDTTDQIEHYCIDKEWYYEDQYDGPTNLRVIPHAYQIEEARQWLLTNADALKASRIHITDADLTPSVYISSNNVLMYEDYEKDTGFPLDDFESPTATDITRESEWDGIYDNRDNYQAVRYYTYKDTEPTRCTSSGKYWWKGYWLQDSKLAIALGLEPHGLKERYYTNCGRLPKDFMPNGFTTEESHSSFREVLDHNNPELHKLEFETLQGMITETLIDLQVTENYQYKFFNVYFGRDNKLHVGLLTFDKTVDDRPQVTCKQSGCYYNKFPFVFQGDLNSRTHMEEFTTACIRHGNHHGPGWITKRSDYAHIHSTDCDAVHWLSTDTSSPCNSLNPKVQFSTESLDETIDFLIRHRKFCRNANCRCTHYYHLLNERNAYAA